VGPRIYSWTYRNYLATSTVPVFGGYATSTYGYDYQGNRVRQTVLMATRTGATAQTVATHYPNKYSTTTLPAKPLLGGQGTSHRLRSIATQFSHSHLHPRNGKSRGA
jgi:hypothetical protein